MTKTEAAEIIANAVTAHARRNGVTQVTKDLVDDLRSEWAGAHTIDEGSPLHRACLAEPAFQTIRTAGRRANN